MERTRIGLILMALCLTLAFSVNSVVAQFDSGGRICWIEGDREDIFLRASSFNCRPGRGTGCSDESNLLLRGVEADLFQDQPILRGLKPKALLR